MICHAIRRAAGALATVLIATLLAACGGDDYAAPQAMPTISSFSATPVAVPMGGGAVLLSWSTANASQLVIDNGVGDVSGSTSKSVNVTAGTTFTLTATNALGSITAATVVTVATQAAPTIASFTATPATLPVGGGSVTLSWTTVGATTLAIDNGVGDVSGLTSKAVNVAAGTTFTLSATNAAGTVSRTTVVSIGSAADRYLDVANGDDANPCTLAAPCKTLGKVFAGAASGATVLVADGIYGVEALGSSVTIPDGVALQATHAGAASIVGVALNAAGSTSISGVVIDAPAGSVQNGCGGINANASSGTPTLTLTGVFFKCAGTFNPAATGGGALNIGGTVQATMTPGALAGGLYTSGTLNVLSTHFVSVTDSATLTITGGVFDGNNSGSTSFGEGVIFEAFGSPAVTLDGVTIRNTVQPAITMFAPGGSVVLRNGTLIDNAGARGGDCGAINLVGANTSFSMDHSTISNSPGVAICVNDQVARGTLSFTQSTITKSFDSGIKSDNTGFGDGATVTADGLTLTDNGAYGIYWQSTQAAIFFDLRNTTITGHQVAGLSVPGSIKLRGSTVSGNTQNGVQLVGVQSIGPNPAADLGTSADPGGNTFIGNGIGLLSQVAAGQIVNAVGNTWIAGQQGADANGRYSQPPGFAPVPKTGPASGVNFKIDFASMLNL